MSVKVTAHQSGCEYALINSYQTLIELAFERGDIPVERLRAVVRSELPVNPLPENGLKADQHQLRIALEKILSKMTSRDWAHAKNLVRKNLKVIERQLNLKTAAQEETRAILNPKLLERTDVNWRAKNYSYDRNRSQKEGYIKRLIKQANNESQVATFLFPIDQDHTNSTWIAFQQQYPIQREHYLDIFLVKDHQAHHLTRRKSVKSYWPQGCVVRPSTSVDCVIQLNYRHFIFMRVTIDGKIETIELNRDLFSGTSKAFLSHLSDGDPVVSIVDGSKVSIYEPMKSSDPVHVIKEAAYSAQWVMAPNKSYVFLPLPNAEFWLVDPFTGDKAQLDLPRDIGTDFQVEVDQKPGGQVHLDLIGISHRWRFKLFE